MASCSISAFRSAAQDAYAEYSTLRASALPPPPHAKRQGEHSLRWLTVGEIQLIRKDLRWISFLHAANLHLDTPFKGIGRTAEHVASALRNTSLEAFDKLVELADRAGRRFRTTGG